MAETERIDRMELALFKLVGTTRKDDRKALAAQIIEEGLDLGHRPPLTEAPTVLAAVGIRAFRPPFMLPGGAELWAFEEHSGEQLERLIKRFEGTGQHALAERLRIVRSKVQKE